jgi:hypothetical protein
VHAFAGFINDNPSSSAAMLAVLVEEDKGAAGDN